MNLSLEETIKDLEEFFFSRENPLDDIIFDSVIKRIIKVFKIIKERIEILEKDKR